MKRHSLFQMVLLYLITASLLTVTLSVVIYSLAGTRVYSRRMAEELNTRASGIAMLAERYQTGQISYDSFIEFATKQQRGAEVYIYDEQGNLIIRSEHVAPDEDGVLAKYVDRVLTHGETVSSSKWRRNTGILVAVPVVDNLQRVSGVVILRQPTAQVFPAFTSLIGALLFSCAIAIILMLIPTYFSTRSIVKPIRQMTGIAAAMANGDFRMRADDSGADEIAMLGSALNFLSGELHNTIQDLISAKDHLNRVLSGVSEGIVALDNDGNITYANPAAATLLGCAEETECVKEKLAPFQETWTEALAEQQKRTQLLAIGEATLLATASPTMEQAEKPAGIILLIQDVTERERLEQTRRDYVANVSHELRTPIASVRSLAEALNDGMVKTEEDRSRYYGYILRESLRLSRLINDLLELSRLQSGSVALVRERFSLGELLTDVTERMRASAFESGIVLTCEAAPDCPDAYSNRDRVEQVLVALVDNAIKYASDDGRVLIQTKVGESLTVSVRNTGHIDEKDLPHLFDRFYKADTSHSSGGTGLGLAIAKEVMTLLGERIWAANDEGEAVMSFTVSIANKA